MTMKKLIVAPITATAATALIVAVGIALIVNGCGGPADGGGGTAASGGGGTPPAVPTVSGVAVNGALIGVTMTLTCSDGTTKLTTIAGTDAAPGEYAFINVPSTCNTPYLIEATGKGFMKPLDGSRKVVYDPLVNVPLKTITFEMTDVNVTPVTSVVAQQAIDAAGSTATVGAALSRLPSDVALDPFRTNIANSLPDRVTGRPPVGAAAIKAVVNSSPAQRPEVAKLSSVISKIVETAVAGDPSKQPSDIMSLLITDISANRDISNAKTIVSVSGVNLTAIQNRSDAIGNLVAATVTDLVSNGRQLSSLKPSDVDAQLRTLFASAQRNIAGNTDGMFNEDLVDNQITSQIITQSESALAPAVGTIRASTASTADQDAKIKAAKSAVDVIQSQELDAAWRTEAAATASATKAIDVDCIVTQTTVAAGIASDKIVSVTENTFISPGSGGQSSTVNVAAVVGLAAKTVVDVAGQTCADLADATKLASIQSTVGASAMAVATQFASFVAPPKFELTNATKLASTRSTAGASGMAVATQFARLVATPKIFGCTDLDTAVMSAAVITVVEMAPAGTLSAAQLANMKTTAESLASQLYVVAGNNVSFLCTLSVSDQIDWLLTQITSSNSLPRTSNFSSPLTVGTIPNGLVSTTTTTLPVIVPTTTTAAGTTTTTFAMPASLRALVACASMGIPQTGWSTFGREDFMRTPLPAARTTPHQVVAARLRVAMAIYTIRRSLFVSSLREACRA